MRTEFQRTQTGAWTLPKVFGFVKLHNSGRYRVVRTSPIGHGLPLSQDLSLFVLDNFLVHHVLKNPISGACVMYMYLLCIHVCHCRDFGILYVDMNVQNLFTGTCRSSNDVYMKWKNLLFVYLQVDNRNNTIHPVAVYMSDFFHQYTRNLCKFIFFYLPLVQAVLSNPRFL